MMEFFCLCLVHYFMVDCCTLYGRLISVDNKFFFRTHELLFCANDAPNPLNYFVNVYDGPEILAELCQKISLNISYLWWYPCHLG